MGGKKTIEKMNGTYLIVLARNHGPIAHLVANAIRRLIRIDIPVIVHNRRARPCLLALVVRGRFLQSSRRAALPFRCSHPLPNANLAFPILICGHKTRRRPPSATRRPRRRYNVEFRLCLDDGSATEFAELSGLFVRWWFGGRGFPGDYGASGAWADGEFSKFFGCAGRSGFGLD